MDTDLEELFSNYDAILEAKKSVTVGDTMDANEFNNLYKLLNQINIPKQNKTDNRSNFPPHRNIVFGLTRKRFNGETELSAASLKYSVIYEELERIGKKICPFPFTSIHINKDVTCPRHKDETNIGKSLLVSFGDYTGSKIVIEGIEYDSKCTPLIFNGFLAEHWNTEDLEGTKCSLIFYNIKRV